MVLNKKHFIDVTSGLSVSGEYTITAGASDLFVFRWSSVKNNDDGTCSYPGKTKFSSGGKFVPGGDALPSRFIHVSGDIHASGGGGNPCVSTGLPLGPTLPDGTLVEGSDLWLPPNYY